MLSKRKYQVCGLDWPIRSVDAARVFFLRSTMVLRTPVKSNPMEPIIHLSCKTSHISYIEMHLVYILYAGYGRGTSGPTWSWISGVLSWKLISLDSSFSCFLVSFGTFCQATGSFTGFIYNCRRTAFLNVSFFVSCTGYSELL